MAHSPDRRPRRICSRTRGRGRLQYQNCHDARTGSPVTIRRSLTFTSLIGLPQLFATSGLTRTPGRVLLLGGVGTSRSWYVRSGVCTPGARRSMVMQTDSQTVWLEERMSSPRWRSRSRTSHRWHLGSESHGFAKCGQPTHILERVEATWTEVPSHCGLCAWLGGRELESGLANSLS
jgi:hypothetical protein